MHRASEPARIKAAMNWRVSGSYVRDTWESRYMTIDAGLYRDIRTRPRKVVSLTRGQLNDYAHNEWKAPANTYLEPNTNYWFMLDCVSGCANDNVGPVR